jgi:D-methionine transport system ATP-binding protein
MISSLENTAKAGSTFPFLASRLLLNTGINMIELTGLTKSYDQHIALSNINLFIQEGEIFGIIGKSGAGKSTLLRCLNLLETPDQGSVIIDGENITAFRSHDLRRARHKMAMIFQHFNLLSSKTVFDNIALPMRIQGIDEDTIRQKIEELLPLVELSEKVNAYPAQLSGGQKQRVAIARALTCSPKILLCDEATSALDPETTDSILTLLKKINQLYGITIVLITHEMEVVKRICHRLAVMDHGEIIEMTALSSVFSRKDSVARGLLYAQLSPELPMCLISKLTQQVTHHPVVRLFFEGEGATVPFISQTSRDLNLDINILLANIDRFDSITCGVLVAELTANQELLDAFIKRCEASKNTTVEILGYVNNDVL